MNVGVHECIRACPAWLLVKGLFALRSQSFPISINVCQYGLHLVLIFQPIIKDRPVFSRLCVKSVATHAVTVLRNVITDDSQQQKTATTDIGQQPIAIFTGMSE